MFSSYGGGCKVGGFSWWIAKALLYGMFWMVVTSVLYSSSCRLQVYGMSVSVNVGFLYMAILQFVGVLWMVTSRKFIWLSVLHPAVNLSLRCNVLKSLDMFWMSVWLVS